MAALPPTEIDPPSLLHTQMSLSHIPPLAPGNNASWDDDVFSAYVHHVREDIIQRRQNLPYLRSIADMRIRSSDSELWYGDAPDGPYYVKLIGGPGTLACNILCQKADLPRYNCNLEIIGDDVREVERKPLTDEGEDEYLEDCNEEIAQLPLITIDNQTHFTKKPKYKQEIKYLLRCKGSPHIVQLLGRTEDGLLVFPKFAQTLTSTVHQDQDQGRIQNIKRWMLDIIDGVAYLHSLGIIHRDLTMRNILDSDPLVICDLECLHATYYPPELDSLDYTKFSPASDVFALGGVLWECCFYNNPPHQHAMLMNPPPPPFLDIFLACTRERAEERPSLGELRAMYENVGIVGR